MRQIVLVVSLLFIALIAVLTVLDIVHNGLNALDAVAILILGPVHDRDRRGTATAASAGLPVSATGTFGACLHWIPRHVPRRASGC